jgi:DNA (cytosine-5)-methyltransferase 1
MKKYSEIREILDIKPEKDIDNQQAYVTHYLHNKDNGISHYFKEPAIKYLVNYNYAKNNLLFDWDIPFPTPEKYKFKFIDLFAGIGGLRIAYQNNGGKCVFSSEWNKFSKITYEANFGEVPLMQAVAEQIVKNLIPKK